MDNLSEYEDNHYYELEPKESLTVKESDILLVLDTYLTLMKYLLCKPDNTKKKKLKKDIKKIEKVKKSLLSRDDSIKKYLREDGGYIDYI